LVDWRSLGVVRHSKYLPRTAIVAPWLDRAVIDPYGRWRDPGQKPPYAGLATFASFPWSEDADELAGIDVAIVGAPFDSLASDRVGTRDGPRAIRLASRPLGPEVGSGVDPEERLRLLDYGDAPVVPFDVDASRAAIEETVGQFVAAGAAPLVLGGDHSITLPALRACSNHHGRLGLIHFDAHTDTGQEIYRHPDNHGTMMRELVLEGHVDPAHYVQIGLRGHWPGPDVFAWQAEVGISHFTAEDVRRRGIDDVAAAAIEVAGDGPVYLSADIDVLDPPFAGRTGTPEPGGLQPRELLAAVRRMAEALRLVGVDVVETVPATWGTADSAARTAAGVVGAAITGIAAARG
jgi:agmatinase